MKQENVTIAYDLSNPWAVVINNHAPRNDYSDNLIHNWLIKESVGLDDKYKEVHTHQGSCLFPIRGNPSIVSYVKCTKNRNPIANLFVDQFIDGDISSLEDAKITKSLLGLFEYNQSSDLVPIVCRQKPSVCLFLFSPEHFGRVKQEQILSSYYGYKAMCSVAIHIRRVPVFYYPLDLV